jgi:mRNA interferase MazF
VVVQNDIFNRSAIATSVVWLITSNLKRSNAPGNVLLKKGHATLAKASVVNISQILTVDKTDLVEYLGQLSSTTASAVRDGLHLIFEQVQDYQ